MLCIGIGDISLIKTRKFQYNMWIYVIMCLLKRWKKRERDPQHLSGTQRANNVLAASS